jgi:hypothetical protein
VQEDVQMKNVVVGLGRGLSGNLAEAGNNLSVGQVCQPTAFVSHAVTARSCEKSKTREFLVTAATDVPGAGHSHAEQGSNHG